MILEYFIKEPTTDLAFEVFQAVHQNTELKEFCRKKEGIFETRLFSLTESIQPFLEDSMVLDLLKTQDLACLPIIKFNQQIYQTGSFPSPETLADLLDIGITIQEKPD